MAYLTQEEIEATGFKSVGRNVRISKMASIYGASKIEIGDDTRIDDFCVLSAGEGGIVIGSFVHIAVYSSLIGAATITLEDFTNISSRVAIYSSNDDYSGKWLTSPCVPKEYTNVTHGNVTISKHVIIGVGSCILPNVKIGAGAAIGAFSLVNKDIAASVIAVGVPAKVIKERSKEIFELEKLLIAKKEITGTVNGEG
ncbi:MAG TPA: acyltransferase [Candidatus Babeliaceae bacterium]|nr:acyltransferase [Candidatus Babeliaceae bacterium]